MNNYPYNVGSFQQHPGGGSGTVTSVGMTVPSILSVTPATITTTGTFAVTLATQSANRVLAGPTSGGAAAPTFRVLVAADIPAAGGGEEVQYNASGVLTGTPKLRVLGGIHVFESTATTNATLSCFQYNIDCSGTATAGFGGHITMAIDNNSSAVTAGSLGWEWTTASVDVARAVLRARDSSGFSARVLTAAPVEGITIYGVDLGSSSTSVALKVSGSSSGNDVYTLPVAPPASNGMVLSCTTAGVMSWVTTSEWTQLRRTTDGTAVNNSTTLVSDTVMTWTATFTGTVEWEGHIRMSFAGGGGTKLSILNASAHGTAWGNTASAFTGLFINATSVIVAAASAYVLMQFRVTFDVTNTTVYAIQMAQNSAVAFDTKILAGSYIRYRQVA